MTQEQLIAKQLLKAIQVSIDKFNAATPNIQNRIADKLELLLKDLEVKNGNIAQSASNLKAIGKIKSELEAIIFDDGYKKSVADFIKSFDEITNLQNQYFAAVSKKYKPNNLLKEIKNQSVESALQYLTEAGINANVTQKMQDILRQNITSGARFSNANEQLRNFIKTNDKGLGALERYTKQITNDTLNQYAASYSDIVTNDLGLEWYEYTGPLIETSRCFCEALIKKKYIHISELPNIVKGNFDEFKKADCAINSKYDLPEGMIPNTNAQNFKIYRGGYNCNHQLIPVSEVAVPESVKNSIKTSTGQPTKTKVSTNNISSVITEIDKAVKKEVNNSINLISEIHSLPQGLSEIPIKSIKSSEKNGAYSYSPSGQPVKIEISTIGKTKEITFAHEFGHYLDHQAFNKKGVFDSDVKDTKINKIVEEAKKTDKIKEYQNIIKTGKIEFNGKEYGIGKQVQFYKYLVRNKEIWARAYAQYIAQKSGNKEMSKLISSRSDHWNNEDFSPIYKMIDEMLKEEGLLND